MISQVNRVPFSMKKVSPVVNVAERLASLSVMVTEPASTVMTSWTGYESISRIDGAHSQTPVSSCSSSVAKYTWSRSVWSSVVKAVGGVSSEGCHVSGSGSNLVMPVMVGFSLCVRW